jgi:hypothetical protein
MQILILRSTIGVCCSIMFPSSGRSPTWYVDAIVHFYCSVACGRYWKEMDSECNILRLFSFGIDCLVLIHSAYAQKHSYRLFPWYLILIFFFSYSFLWLLQLLGSICCCSYPTHPWSLVETSISISRSFSGTQCTCQHPRLHPRLVVEYQKWYYEAVGAWWIGNKCLQFISNNTTGKFGRCSVMPVLSRSRVATVDCTYLHGLNSMFAWTRIWSVYG